MKPLVIYHDKCTDGFGAAFAAWMKLGDDAEYVPASYGQTDALPDYVERDVYILDFSFKREVMDDIFREARRVVWRDHHKTAFEMWCGGIPESQQFDQIGNGEGGGEIDIFLDNNKSGALLAWEYFHPGTEVPRLIQRIDDRDRWVFQYEDSKALHAGLASLKPWTFDGWRVLLLGHMYARVVNDGQAILTAQDADVARMAQQAMKCGIKIEVLPHGPDIGEVLRASHQDGYGRRFDGLACNASLHQSELGHVLATQSGTYGLIWYVAPDGRANCSLRSNGDYDVSAIAKAFGGGGHRNAAGFQTDIHTLLSWLK